MQGYTSRRASNKTHIYLPIDHVWTECFMQGIKLVVLIEYLSWSEETMIVKQLFENPFDKSGKYDYKYKEIPI